ncbi:hypothetical protein HYPSUDRAFT_53524 [Hypholoma sublateritium FD-334 SS-4]|uniref:HAT C-terminal dimerisation domain-containing protein n=1 Tax=Hypholoma sublateritium (strain FD-334 SS-4) TaxID=945553 RepID=A0A0D2MLL3_HYPSF|nr:hypothetical protein HYPSUDRAFT_53524 [Hypholoma sublateritium FD-334 SS-4]
MFVLDGHMARFRVESGGYIRGASDFRSSLVSARSRGPAVRICIPHRFASAFGRRGMTSTAGGAAYMRHQHRAVYRAQYASTTPRHEQRAARGEGTDRDHMIHLASTMRAKGAVPAPGVVRPTVAPRVRVAVARDDSVSARRTAAEGPVCAEASAGARYVRGICTRDEARLRRGGHCGLPKNRGAGGGVLRARDHRIHLSSTTRVTGDVSARGVVRQGYSLRVGAAPARIYAMSAPRTTGEGGGMRISERDARDLARDMGEGNEEKRQRRLQFGEEWRVSGVLRAREGALVKAGGKGGKGRRTATVGRASVYRGRYAYQCARALDVEQGRAPRAGRRVQSVVPTSYISDSSARGVGRTVRDICGVGTAHWCRGAGARRARYLRVRVQYRRGLRVWEGGKGDCVSAGRRAWEEAMEKVGGDCGLGKNVPEREGGLPQAGGQGGKGRPKLPLGHSHSAQSSAAEEGGARVAGGGGEEEEQANGHVMAAAGDRCTSVGYTGRRARRRTVGARRETRRGWAQNLKAPAGRPPAPAHAGAMRTSRVDHLLRRSAALPASGSHARLLLVPSEASQLTNTCAPGRRVAAGCRQRRPLAATCSHAPVWGACDIFSIPGSAVAVECVFWGGRDTISLRRASLQPDTVRVLMIVKQRLRLARIALEKYDEM